eukprot:768438-Hanusia_phi.AAC.5
MRQWAPCGGASSGLWPSFVTPPGVRGAAARSLLVAKPRRRPPSRGSCGMLLAVALSSDTWELDDSPKYASIILNGTAVGRLDLFTYELNSNNLQADISSINEGVHEARVSPPSNHGCFFCISHVQVIYFDLTSRELLCLTSCGLMFNILVPQLHQQTFLVTDDAFSFLFGIGALDGI